MTWNMAWGLYLNFVSGCISILFFILWLGAMLGCGCKNIVLHWAKFLVRLGFHSPSNCLLNYVLCNLFNPIIIKMQTFQMF